MAAAWRICVPVLPHFYASADKSHGLKIAACGYASLIRQGIERHRTIKIVADTASPIHADLCRGRYIQVVPDITSGFTDHNL